MPEPTDVFIFGKEDDPFDHVINLRLAFDGAEDITQLRKKLTEMDDYLESIESRGFTLADEVDGGWVPVALL